MTILVRGDVRLSGQRWVNQVGRHEGLAIVLRLVFDAGQIETHDLKGWTCERHGHGTRTRKTYIGEGGYAVMCDGLYGPFLGVGIRGEEEFVLLDGDDERSDRVAAGP